MRTHAQKPSAKDESGVALVEFALVLPILLVLVLGILDFGRAFNYWIDETHLANEAARFAAVNRNQGGLQAYVKSQGTTCELRGDCTSKSIATPLQVCIEYPEGALAGKPVRVTATATYHWLPFLGLGVTETTIRGTAEMRLEAPPTDVPAGCA
jgi:Flp pilus assembly protein TadG